MARMLFFLLLITVPAESGIPYREGIPLKIFFVESGRVMVDGVVKDSIERNTFLEFPALRQQVAEVAAFTRAVETREGALELWTKKSLSLAMGLRTLEAPLLYSSTALRPTFMNYSPADPLRVPPNASVVIELKDCQAPAPGNCMTVTMRLELREE